MAIDLPFLVVYGAHVWKALFIAVLAGACGAGWLVRRYAARAIQRRAVHDLERGACAEGETVVHGTLRGTGAEARAATLSAEPIGTVRGTPTTVSWRSGELWVETEDGRAVLDGEIRVVAGSRVAASRNGVPALVTDAHLEAARAGAPWLHRIQSFLKAQTLTAVVDVVGPGDRVAVRGCLERTPSAEPTGYRDSAGTFVLRPHAERAVLELAACRPGAAVPRMPRLALGLVLGILSMTAWVMMKNAGESWSERCSELDPEATVGAIPEEPLEITNTHVCALAAAMPKSRSEALSGLRRLLEGDPYIDERSVGRLAGAIELDDGCAEAARALLAHARFEDAATRAHACGDSRTEYAALVAQGRFEEAVRIRVPAEGDRPELPHIPTLIAAGAWTEAAQRAQQQADLLARRSLDPDPVPPSVVRRMRCLAEALRSFGGDRDAERRLRALDADEPGTCTAALAAVASPEEHRRLLQRVAEHPSGSSRQVRQMMWAAGLSKRWYEVESDGAHFLASTDALGGAGVAYLAWLVAMERGDRPDLDPRARAGLLRWRAIAEVLDDRADAAVATAREALALVDALPPDELGPRFIRFLPAMARLHTPATALGSEVDLEAAHRSDWESTNLYFSRLMLRARLPTSRESFRRPEYHGALIGAQQGEGRLLARYLGKRLASWRDGDILAVLPWIRTDREAVGRRLAFGARYFYQEYSFYTVMPWEHALHAAIRREGMQLAGMPEEAARWAAIYGRFDAVLTDRQRLLALMLSEE